MKKNISFLLIIAVFTFCSYGQSVPLTTDEYHKIVNSKLKEIEQKYSTAPDTSALVKIFLDNAPTMIKNLKEIKIPDSIRSKYPITMKNHEDILFESETQKYYNELLDGNMENMRNLTRVSLRYNELMENSLILHDSLSAYLVVSFLPLDSKGIMNTLYYTANYKVLKDNSIAIISFINNHLNKIGELKKLSKWSDDEISKMDSVPKNRYKYSESIVSSQDSIAVALKILLSDKQERIKLAKDTAFVKMYLKEQLYLQALLGNAQAEEKLIESYKKDATFKGRREILRQLVFINSPKTIKSVVESFNDEIYNSSCSASIRISIINELSRVYSNEKILRKITQIYDYPIISGRALYPFTHPSRNPLGLEPEWVESYVKSVLKWIKDEFGVIPNGNNKTLKLQKNHKGCGGIDI